MPTAKRETKEIATAVRFSTWVAPFELWVAASGVFNG